MDTNNNTKRANMALSQSVQQHQANSSYIRKMFEQGEELKKKLGKDKVYDFSLGNPDTEPPEGVIEAYKKYANGSFPGLHRYMSNAGVYDVREKVAKRLTDDSGVNVPVSNVVMTVGAAGAINTLLKAILNPEDEVIALAPYFLEYGFYVDNYLGKLVPVETQKDTFMPDIDEIERHVTEKTKAIILNSPNNPTGVVYSAERLIDIENMLKKCEKKYGTTIFVISDEPYVKIAYDGVKVPNMLACFENAVIVNSFSKSLALAGERIGFVAVSGRISCAEALVGGIVFCNRVLGFVNAPALAQYVVADNLDISVNIDEFKEKRDELYGILIEAGFECNKPQGAFYLFPKIMGNDEEEFKNNALKHNILIVPGFGVKGHFRAAYCVDINTIRNSKNAFMTLAAEYRGKG